MNPQTKINIKEFNQNNISRIIGIFIIIHVLIGFSFLLYHHFNPKCDHFKYQINDGNKRYQTNEVYFGDKFLLFFDGDMGTYESNDRTVKIYSEYGVDTVANKIIITKK